MALSSVMLGPSAGAVAAQTWQLSTGHTLVSGRQRAGHADAACGARWLIPETLRHEYALTRSCGVSLAWRIAAAGSLACLRGICGERYCRSTCRSVTGALRAERPIEVSA